MPESVAESILPRAIIAQGRVTRRNDRPPVVTSQASDWPGVLIEAGTNDVIEVDDLVIGQHYLSLNADSKPFMFELKGPYGYRQLTMPPQSFWVVPAGDSITLRVNTPIFPYVRIALDPVRLGRLLRDSDRDGAPERLRFAHGLIDPPIAHLLMVLVAEARYRNP